jgi:hypothetical protein
MTLPIVDFDLDLVVVEELGVMVESEAELDPELELGALLKFEVNIVSSNVEG